jgi:hypothetical protein
MIIDEIVLNDQLVFSLANQKDKLQEYNDANAEGIRLGVELSKLRQQQKQDLKDFEAQFIKTNDAVVKGLTKQIQLQEIIFENFDEDIDASLKEYLDKFGEAELDLNTSSVNKYLEAYYQHGRILTDAYLQDLVDKNGRMRALEFEQELYLARRIAELKASSVSEDEATRMAQLEAEKLFSRERQNIAIQDAEAKKAAQIKGAQDVANTLATLEAAFFEKSKVFAIAKAVVDTYASAVAAFKDTPGPVWVKAAASAAAIAAGLANVKKIVSTKPGTAATGSAIPTPTASAGRMPMVGNAFNPSAPITMGNANLSAGMAGAMGSRDMGITVNAKVDRKGLAIAVREGEREIKTQQFTFA